MLSQADQAVLNLEQARELRTAGRSYREIRRQLGLTSNQLGHIRRVLKREKGARTRLQASSPQATDRDLPIGQSALPPGLRLTLRKAGYRTLGDLVDRMADRDFPGLETMSGIGPHKARLVKRLLDHFGLLPGSEDLRAEIEQLFPEFRAGSAPDIDDG